MYGFIGALNMGGCYTTESIDLVCYRHSSIEVLHNEITFKDGKIKQFTLDKFPNDKVFYSDDEVVIIIEGVIYNFLELEKMMKCNCRGKLLKMLLHDNTVEELAKLLDGYYAAFIYDKVENLAYLISDCISYRTVWYGQFGSTFYFSTDIDWLYQTILKNEKELKLDLDGAYCLLNHGYMLGNITPIKNVKKLIAGNILTVSNNKAEQTTYYMIPTANYIESISSSKYREILLTIDDCFMKSVDKAFKKDAEYGYKHCATLSGGLDSRLVVFMAKRLGYDTLCLTMGESGCADINIASSICNELKLEHLVYELNNGLFIKNMENAIIANGGTVLSLGFLHSFRLASLINLEEYGAMHSGDLGDFILGGSFIHDLGKQAVSLDRSMYSLDYIDGFSSEFKRFESNRYKDQFHFDYYNRGLNSAGNGCFGAQFYTECSAPFIDRSLIDTVFSLPYKYLANHRLYIDYMKEYLPQSCIFNWEKTGCKPTATVIEKNMARYIRGLNKRLFHKNYSMNPFEYWYCNNSELRQLFSDIYQNCTSMINPKHRLWNDILRRYKSERIMDKSLAITLLLLIKRYAIEVDE